MSRLDYEMYNVTTKICIWLQDLFKFTAADVIVTSDVSKIPGRNTQRYQVMR